MTTIITRLFPDMAGAQKAMDRLVAEGVPRRDVEIIGPGEDARAAMARAQVHASAIGPYAERLEGDRAVLAVRATYKPLGAARMTREMLSGHETIDIGEAEEEHRPPWQPERATSVLTDHPHFLTVKGLDTPGLVSPKFGIDLLRPRKPKDNLLSPDKRISRMFWPMPLVTRKGKADSVIHGGRHMSKAFWPMPLLSTGKRSKSVIPGGALPFSRLFGLRVLSPRS